MMKTLGQGEKIVQGLQRKDNDFIQDANLVTVAADLVKNHSLHLLPL